MNNQITSSNGSFTEKIKSFFKALCSHNVTVSRTKNFFTVPVIVFVIAALLLWKISFIAILISLFCGVEYTVSGESFPTGKKITFRANS